MTAIASPTVPQPRALSFLAATWVIMVRELRPVLRDPFSVVFSLVQPLAILLLFAPLLAGTAGEPLPQTLGWFVPGVLVMLALFGVGMTGSNLLFEISSGSHERTLVAPVPRSSLIVGRALKEIVPLTAQSLLVIGVAALMGYRADVLGTAIGLVLLALFGVGLGSLSYALAVATSSTDWMFWAIQQSLLFPLMLLSGMMLPLEAAPGWMKVAASVNPLSHLVDAERALAAGDLLSDAVVRGTVATLITLAVGLFVGTRVVNRGE